MPIRPQASLSAKVLIAIAIGALAIGVRWRHISAEPLDFQPARQYHSAQIARAYYVEWSPGMPAWKTRIVHAYLREDGPIEAPILETIAASAVARDGPRTAVKKPSGYAFAVLAVLPTVGFYVYSTITNTFVAAGVRDKLAPRLWGESFYWRGWRSMIEEVLRAPGFGARS